MRVALLSDAHCNSVGLVACLEKIRGLDVDEIYFLGDAVGYLSDPEPALALLRGSGARCQQGNHEAMLVGNLPLDDERDAFYRLSEQRRRLPADTVRRLAAWPLVREPVFGDVRALLSHGSPAPSLEERIYEDGDWQPGDGFAYDVAFVGHTHRAFVRRFGGVQLVNVGSCGLPRDRGDLASFVVYDVERREPLIYRVPFDVEEALERHGAGVAPEVRAVFGRRGDYHGTIV